MGSEVVYTPAEKVKKIYGSGTLQPPKFMPTYYEWLKEQGIQISKSQFYINSYSTVYTVPEGYTLFLQSAMLASSQNVIGATLGLVIGGNLSVSGEAGNSALLYFMWSDVMTVSDVAVGTYPYPLKISEKSSIVVGTVNFSSINQCGRATIQGFLVSNSILQSI